MTCIGGASLQDQLIDEKESRRRSSSAEDPGELLHRQTEEEGSEHQPRRIQEIGGEPRRLTSSTKKDQGVDLHRQRIQESFYIDRRRKGRSSTSSSGSNELENGGKSDELKERSETGRTKERLEIERTRERSETGRTERTVENRTN